MKSLTKIITLLFLIQSLTADAAPLIWESRLGETLDELTGTESETTFVDLSFTFPFKDSSYTRIFVGSNGTVQLGSLGNSGGIHSHFASYMDEFTADDAPSIAVNTGFDLFANGTVHFNDFGSQAVFTWNEIGTFVNENALSSFQIQIFDDGRIYISLNGILDDVTEDLIDDLNEGIVVGISSGDLAEGTDPGPSDLTTVFASGTEIFGRWCHDEPDECGFRGHGQTDRLIGGVNTDFNLDFSTITFHPTSNGFKVNDIIFSNGF